MNLSLLNKLKAGIINFANTNGIILSQSFKTKQAFNDFVVSLAIKTLTDNGVSFPEAFDKILGAGTYQTMSDDCWNKLNSVWTILKVVLDVQ